MKKMLPQIDEAGLSEMTEEEQLRLAMERSREQFMDSGSSLTTAPSELAAQLTDSDTTDSLPMRDPSPVGPLPNVETQERLAAAQELEETVRKAHDPGRLCHLVVRLPQGEREMVTLPASAPIKVRRADSPLSTLRAHFSLSSCCCHVSVQ